MRTQRLLIRKGGVKSAALCALLSVFLLLSACSSSVRLEVTPEHCYEGTDIQTLDYVCSNASLSSAGTDSFTYNSSDVMTTYYKYTSYLSGRGYDASPSGLIKSVYKTEYGKITTNLRGMGDVTHVSGTIKVSISR